MTWFVVAWILLLTVGLVVEGLALANKIGRDTLSEQVWFLRTKRWGRAILMPWWGWMTYHFWLEPRAWDVDSGVWMDDWILIFVLGGVATAFNLYEEKADT